jgi:hypothetical protein
MVTGLFKDRKSAERAYQVAFEHGYDQAHINLIMSDETRTRHFSSGHGKAQTELGNKAAESVGTDSTVGGTLAAIAAAMAAIGTSALSPWLGLVITGPLSSGLAGTDTDAKTEGLVYALTGWGIPEGQIKKYEAGIKKGSILMGVKTRSDTDAQILTKEWKKIHGEEVH